MLSPRELKRAAFSKALGGYAQGEVDEYIRFLLSKYSELYNEYIQLGQQLALCSQKLEDAKSEENAISTTIVNAQKMADSIVSEARKKAEGIVGAVSDSCDGILDAYLEKVKLERDKLEKCERAVAEFKNSLLNAYKQHLDLIYDIMPDEEPTAYLSDEELESKAVETANNKIASVLGSGEDADEKSDTCEEQNAENPCDTVEDIAANEGEKDE